MKKEICGYCYLVEGTVRYGKHEMDHLPLWYQFLCKMVPLRYRFAYYRLRARDFRGAWNFVFNIEL
jgi:hypothetical protein